MHKTLPIPLMFPAWPGRAWLPEMTLAAALLQGCGGGGGDAGAPLTPVTPVKGPAWWGFGRAAQHSATGEIATQDLTRTRC